MNKHLFLLIVFFATTMFSFGQKTSKFGVELQTSPFALVFQSDKKALVSTSLGINAVYFPTEKLSLRVGASGLHLIQNETKTYDNISMLKLGCGYIFYSDSKRNTLWELNASVGNEMKEFGKFNNLAFSGDIRFYIKESFYMGVGAEYLNLKNVRFVGNPTGNTSLFFLAGYRFRF